MHYAGLQQHKSYGRDAAARWLHCTVPPFVVSVESAALSFRMTTAGKTTQTNLMHSISMRCCSATLFSLFTLRCRAVKMLRLWSR